MVRSVRVRVAGTVTRSRDHRWADPIRCRVRAESARYATRVFERAGGDLRAVLGDDIYRPLAARTAAVESLAVEIGERTRELFQRFNPEWEGSVPVRADSYAKDFRDSAC